MAFSLQIDYTFRYYVDDAKFGISMDHWEERRDDRIIGRYALLEPGGYVRSVYYVVDAGSGFRSSVRTRRLSESDFKILFYLNFFNSSFH